MKNKEENNFFRRLNNKIANLNKLATFGIIVVYALALFVIYVLVFQSKPYIAIPNYSHVYFNEDINPQISVIGLRTSGDDGINLKYSVSVQVHGRINSTSTNDPRYMVNNFKMSAAITDDIKSNNVDSMYYFTEQASYSTPTTHTYTIDNTTISQHPLTFYTLLEYKKDGDVIFAAFKEDVMLQPTATDINAFQNAYANANTQDPEDPTKTISSTAIYLYDKSNNKFGTFTVISKEEENDFSGGVRIAMDTLSYESRHHVDMQTWIETASGEYLPYIGVYGYSSQKSNYSQSGRKIAKELHPKYICAKLVYYFGENDYKEYYFKQDITSLAQAFSSNPVAMDGEAEEENPKNNAWVSILIGISIGVIIVAAVAAVSIVVVKKRENKNKDNLDLNVESDNEQDLEDKK